MTAQTRDGSAAAAMDTPLYQIYQRLYQAYGPQGWWPGDGPFAVIVGAILTQAVSWRNVERAMGNLQAAACWSFPALYRISRSELAELLHPAGYYNAKARKLQAFAAHLVENYGGDLAAMLSQDTQALRAELLSIHGIGPETADDILVYAAGLPSFVIDAYTRRILQRLGLAPDTGKTGYSDLQRLFHQQLPPEVALFNEYHALLDCHAKIACRKIPLCADCCLRDLCLTGQRLTSS